MINFGLGGFQWLVQAVPLTALVCAATIALILLLVRIVAQSLASQPRRIQESLPSSFMVHSTSPTSPFLARDYDYSHPTSPLFNTPVPARALDFTGSSPTNFYNKELPRHKTYSSFESSPISRHMESLTETLSLEVASKAQHCGDDPHVVQLCVNLVQHYNLDVDHRLPPRGLSIFHQACRSGSPHLVASLVQLANISRQTGRGETPLYLAVQAAAERTMISERAEDLEVVRILLEGGANVDASTNLGITPLQEASRRGCTSLVRLLLDWGAAVDKVWGNHSDVENFHFPPSSKTRSPPSSWVKNTSSPPLNPSSPFSDDFEDTLSDLVGVKEEKIDNKIKTTAKKRKSKSPKFSVVTRSMAKVQQRLAITMEGWEDINLKALSVTNSSSRSSEASTIPGSTVSDQSSEMARKNSQRKK